MPQRKQKNYLGLSSATYYRHLKRMKKDETKVEDNKITKNEQSKFNWLKLTSLSFKIHFDNLSQPAIMKLHICKYLSIIK